MPADEERHGEIHKLKESLCKKSFFSSSSMLLFPFLLVALPLSACPYLTTLYL